jgi:RNA polymerase sigma factor (TIGR02999 family)
MMPMSELTQLLRASQDGDEDAMNRAFGVVYAELKRLARRALSARRSSTLDTTGLVHECYLRFAAAEAQPFDRAHFFHLAARVMRQLVCDHARRRLADKRGGGAVHDTLDENSAALRDEAQRLVELDDLLRKLADSNARQARVVECRVFAGLSLAETAEACGVSERTVELDWRKARDWLSAHG